MEKLGLNLGYLLVQAASFIIIFVVLRAWVYKPLLGFIEKRKKTIEDGLENSKDASKAKANADIEAEKVINDARQKSEVILREARDRASELEKKLRTAVEEETAKTRAETRSEIRAEFDEENRALRQEVTTLALAAAGQLMKKKLDPKTNQHLIDEFFAGITADQKASLKGMITPGSTVSVVSALPLSSAEKEKIKSEIKSVASSKSDVKFSTDPALLGGLLIRIGDQVLDGSLASQAQRLKKTLVQ